MSGARTSESGTGYALRRVAGLAAESLFDEAAAVLNGLDEAERDAVRTSARREGLDPLVIAADAGTPGIDGRRRAAATRDLLVEGTLKAATSALSDAGCECLLEKGACFRDALYPETWMRPMVDVDLLVRPADLDRCAGVLAEAGFRALGPHRSRPVSGRLSLERIMVVDRDAVAVELHADLTHERFGFGDDVGAIFDRARATRWPGAGTLCHEDHLLHAAVHLARSGLRDRLRHYLDVDRMVRAWELDWGALAGRSERWGCSTALFFVLEAVRCMFASPVPDRVMKALSPRGPRAWVLRALFDPAADPDGGEPGAAWKALVLPALYDRPADMFGYAAWTAATRAADFVAASAISALP